MAIPLRRYPLIFAGDDVESAAVVMKIHARLLGGAFAVQAIRFPVLNSQ